MLSILDNYYSDDVLDHGYDFVRDIPGAYKYPGASAGVAETVAAVRAFPVNDAPGVFGLHANANTAVALADTSNLLNVMLTVDSASQAVATPTVLENPQRRRTSSVGDAPNMGAGEEEGDRARVEEILSRLPDEFDLKEAEKRCVGSVMVWCVMRQLKLDGWTRALGTTGIPSSTSTP